MTLNPPHPLPLGVYLSDFGHYVLNQGKKFFKFCCGRSPHTLGKFGGVPPTPPSSCLLFIKSSHAIGGIHRLNRRLSFGIGMQSRRRYDVPRGRARFRDTSKNSDAFDAPNRPTGNFRPISVPKGSMDNYRGRKFFARDSDRNRRMFAKF